MLLVQAVAIEDEAHRVGPLALALAKGVHELLELGGPFDLEEDLVVAVGDLDVEVLGLAGVLLLGSAGVRHGGRRGLVGCGS